MMIGAGPNNVITKAVERYELRIKETHLSVVNSNSFGRMLC